MFSVSVFVNFLDVLAAIDFDYDVLEQTTTFQKRECLALLERSRLIVLSARAHSPVSPFSDCKAYFNFIITQF